VWPERSPIYICKLQTAVRFHINYHLRFREAIAEALTNELTGVGTLTEQQEDPKTKAVNLLFED